MTNRKSTSTKEYAIKYFFNTSIMSPVTSFLKEAYELSVINTKKVFVRLVYYLCILGDAIIHLAVAVVSLIRIVREGKPIHDADLFTGKRYIQSVNFITELVPQKVNKKK